MAREEQRKAVWFLVGNGGMDSGDYDWGVYRDPFPHSLLSTRQRKKTTSVQ